MKQGAGFLIVCPSRKSVLLALRNDLDPTWANFGGIVEKCESPIQAAKRELLEEAGFIENVHYTVVSSRPINVTHYNHFVYKCYLAISSDEHSPLLNYEHGQFVWSTLDELPNHLHFGLKNILSDEKVLKKIKSLFE